MKEEMKKLEKIRLSEAVNVLTDDEMKFVRGGGSINCIRLRKNGQDWATFTTDSPEVASAWADVWYALGDWYVSCETYSPYIYC